MNDREAEAVDVDAVERLEDIESGDLVRCAEVEVGGEASCAAGSELPQRCPALEDEVSLEQTLLVNLVQREVLGDVEKCCIPAALDSLVVPGDVAFGEPVRHAPVPADRNGRSTVSCTPVVGSYVPLLLRGPNHTTCEGLDGPRIRSRAWSSSTIAKR